MSTNPVQPQNMSLEQITKQQKDGMAKFASDLQNTTTNIIDTWSKNYLIVDTIKNKRTEQVNNLLGFINQLSNEGFPQLTQLGNEIKDPEVSNKVLDANNIIMTIAKQILDQVKNDEDAFMKQIQATQNANSPTVSTKVTSTEL